MRRRSPRDSGAVVVSGKDDAAGREQLVEPWQLALEELLGVTLMLADETGGDRADVAEARDAERLAESGLGLEARAGRAEQLGDRDGLCVALLGDGLRQLGGEARDLGARL